MLLAVTGASGFLGRSLVPSALAAGHQVRVLVRPGDPIAPATGADAVPGDLGDRAALARLVAGADGVVHLAAVGVQARDRDWARMVEVNVTASIALAEAAASAGVRCLVAVGTVLEYTGAGRLPDAKVQADVRLDERAPADPGDPYGAAKAAGGILLRARSRALELPCWYLRLASAYGPGDDGEKLLPSALRAALAGRPFEMTPGEQVREWLWIADAAEALLAAASRPPPDGGAIVNVGTGAGEVLSGVVRAAYRAAGADPGLVHAGARPYRPGEVHRLVMDVSRARELLGTSPRTGLGDGLAQLARAAREEARRG